MAGRTIAVGDIHGELAHLQKLWPKLPELDPHDTLVFMGDYVDRGPDSRGVMDFLATIPQKTQAKLVFLCGNHEDGWVRAASGGFHQFTEPPNNGCWACCRSYLGKPADAEPDESDLAKIADASFFPPAIIEWMRSLTLWYEDTHAIYVHASLPLNDGVFLHPSEVKNRLQLLWSREAEFFANYKGKRVVCGHTATMDLPQDLSMYTPDDPTDVWMTQNVIAVDTKCGKTGGFLSALELPTLRVYESR